MLEKKLARIDIAGIIIRSTSASCGAFGFDAVVRSRNGMHHRYRGLLEFFAGCCVAWACQVESYANSCPPPNNSFCKGSEGIGHLVRFG